MSELTLDNITKLIGTVSEAELQGARFYSYCPNHRNVHSFPAHRERCNVALRKYLLEKYNLPDLAAQSA